MKNETERTVGEMQGSLSNEMKALKKENSELRSQINTRDAEAGTINLLIGDVITAVERAHPVPWITPAKNNKIVASPCSHVLHLTDLHYGMVTKPEQVEEFGVYNPAIAEKRIKYLVQKIIDSTIVQRSSFNVNELVILGTGDWCCFPKGTPIKLADGKVKPIEDIRKGDVVLSNPEPRMVLDSHVKDATVSDEMIEVRLCKSMPLVGTKEHKVSRLPREMVETGWNPGGKRALPFIERDKTQTLSCSDIEDCSLENMRVGDYCVVRPFRPTDGAAMINIPEITGLPISVDNNRLLRKVRGRSPVVISKTEIELDNDFLWLMGMFLAEGSCQKGRSGDVNTVVFTLNISEEMLSDKICAIINHKFGYSPIVRLKPKVSTRTVFVNNQIIATLLWNLSGEGGAETKFIHDAIYRAPRSLLPLIGGWLDGDGGYNRRRQALVGVTVGQNLASQISTILWSERVVHGVCKDESGRNRPAYRIALTGAYGQQIASYTVKHSKLVFTPTYEDGFWVEDCYCLRVMSLLRTPAVGKLYDLQIEGNHYYQVNGLVVHNSGDIHPELQCTNAFPAPVQAVKAGYLIGQMIMQLAPLFPKVRVELITQDNHGRLTKKPQASDGGLNNWGFVVANIAKEYVKEQKNVAVNIHAANSAIVPVGPEQYLIFHGHTMKGWSGLPYYGFDRRVQKEAVSRMNVPTDKHFTRMVFGHFHVAFNGDYWSSGGCVSGTDAFDHSQGRHSKPHQSSWLVHQKHGEFSWTRWWLP